MLVREPGSVHVKGARAYYIGRKWDGKLNGFPAHDEPHAVEAGTEDAARLAHLCVRDSSLWPADEDTAAHCGVPFVPLKLVDGEWVAAPDAFSKE